MHHNLHSIHTTSPNNTSLLPVIVPFPLFIHLLYLSIYYFHLLITLTLSIPNISKDRIIYYGTFIC